MQVKNHSPLPCASGGVAPLSSYAGKTTFKMLQPKPGYKPEPFGGDIKWPTGKRHGEISAQTPWGEQYTGLIKNNYPFIDKGFVYGDQGSAYTVEKRATGEDVAIYFKPMQKEGTEGIGVVVGTEVYNKKYEQQPKE